MSDNVLILSQPDDSHAFYVAEAVERKGGKALIWYTGDFPAASYETIEYDEGLHVGVRGAYQVFSDPAPATVWNRRPSHTYDVSALHPADRTFGSGQCLELRRSMTHLIGESAFWVNPPLSQARAILKPVQLQVARQVGFEIPRTLCSNDLGRIRSFIRKCGGSVVFKQLANVGVWTDGEKRYAPYTTVIREEQLADEPRTAAAPAIFQEIVDKAYELRLTAIGDHVFATRLDPPEDGRATQTDWRLEVMQNAMPMRATTVPSEVEQKVRAYMRAMNIVFGCFDVVVTPEGRHLFLECNEMGQFLFVEPETGAPVLDAFAELLLQRRRDFEWRETPAAVRCDDLRETIAGRMREAAERHGTAHRPRFQEEPADATGRT